MAVNDTIDIYMIRRLLNMAITPKDKGVEYDHSHKPIGSGSFGNVFEAWVKTDKSKKILAMKQIQKTNPKDKDRTLLKGELEAMLRLKPHPNIVQLIDVYTLGNKIHIIMEYCGTNLKKYIHKKDNYPTWFQKLDIARQIAVGVKFLHSGKPQVIHRDLKPENVLLNVDGDTLQVKIADFGLSKSNIDDK